ncbi:hypothetical protein [Thalassospira xiamenensis]|uniref:hypothetical protein n=1 Tax=Thalassospira xiamenensis TaxID=220697 RepID=UPI00148287C1|nr:hypothetical protein [Thalassospira xiamenensis]
MKPANARFIRNLCAIFAQQHSFDQTEGNAIPTHPKGLSHFFVLQIVNNFVEKN